MDPTLSPDPCSSAATRHPDFLDSLRCLVRRILGPQFYREDTLPPARPILWVEKYMRAPPSAAAMMMPVTPGTQFGPPPSVQSPRPKPRSTRRTKGCTDSAAWDTPPPTSESSVTILSSLRIQEVNSLWDANIPSRVEPAAVSDSSV